MLAFCMPQDMILASGSIFARHALVLLLLEAVLAHMLLQFLMGLVVAVAVFALHEGVPNTTVRGVLCMGDGGAATGGGVIVVEMIAVELIAGIGR